MWGAEFDAKVAAARKRSADRRTVPTKHGEGSAPPLKKNTKTAKKKKKKTKEKKKKIKPKKLPVTIKQRPPRPEL